MRNGAAFKVGPVNQKINFPEQAKWLSTGAVQLFPYMTLVSPDLFVLSMRSHCTRGQRDHVSLLCIRSYLPENSPLFVVKSRIEIDGSPAPQPHAKSSQVWSLVLRLASRAGPPVQCCLQRNSSRRIPKWRVLGQISHMLVNIVRRPWIPATAALSLSSAAQSIRMCVRRETQNF